ncbi:DUF3010 family protein [Pseudoalteromonas sp. T1lg48]|uniref:DUF3010 family protein n=1 Tax=Pseudoalteromonas sp. T1lg48 TaxID=2077100 RepID=UPI000CF60EDD|nr:DUF3010 family protein [Pseudoalteromonas sp. T1lg48]
MNTCGVEIKGSEVLLCLLSKDNDVFDIRDVRQTRFVLSDADDTEQVQKFYRDFKKLMEDYGVDSIAIKGRPHKGKFAGGAVGFKMEAALQLISELDVRVINATAMKEQLKRNPIPIDFEETGLKKFQEQAFNTAYVYIMQRTYAKD